jgi:hypothetical protein
MQDAAEEGNLERIKQLIAEGVDPNNADRIGRTALHEAAAAGHVQIVEYLLSLPGINVRTQDRFKTTPLSSAFSLLKDKPENQRQIINMLLSVPDIDVNAFSERPPLVEAILNNEVDIMNRLLSFPDIDTSASILSGYINYPLLEYVVFYGRDVRVETMNALLPRLNIDVVNQAFPRVGETNLDFLNSFLNIQGVNINAKDTLGNTALMNAARMDKTDIVARLLEIPGIDLTATNNQGRSALIMPARQHTQNMIIEALRREYLGRMRDVRETIGRMQSIVPAHRMQEQAAIEDSLSTRVSAPRNVPTQYNNNGEDPAPHRSTNASLNTNDDPQPHRINANNPSGGKRKTRRGRKMRKRSRRARV